MKLNLNEYLVNLAADGGEGGVGITRLFNIDWG